MRTLSRHPSDRFLVVRADLFDLPFEPGSFDGIFSLGVLHHTPAPGRAIEALAPLLRRGGRFAAWFYERRRPDLRWAMPRTWLRELTSNWSDAAKYRMAMGLTTAFFPLGWGLSWCGRAGECAAAFLPYASRHHQGRGDLRRQWTYSVMDTFDWYGPAYDLPQTEEEVRRAMSIAGLADVRRLATRGLAVVGESPTHGRSFTRYDFGFEAVTAGAHPRPVSLEPALARSS
jgi:SAM-dependent methyltransferase